MDVLHGHDGVFGTGTRVGAPAIGRHLHLFHTLTR